MKHTHHKSINFQVLWLDKVDSTNSELRRRVISENPPLSGTLLATTNQTAGRGRAGRKWESGKGANLCCSLFLETSAPMMSIPALTMATALAVDDALHELHIDSHPKWPNDVRAGTGKICGILSERIDRQQCKGVIVGIGLNINMDDCETARIDQPATSILMETGKTYPVGYIMRSVLPHLTYWIPIWMESGFAGLRSDWVEREKQIGKQIEVRGNGKITTGVLKDYGPHGECRLLCNDGKRVSIWSGDIHTAT